MVDNPRQYSTAEVDRMMKLQEVMLKTMAKKITWWAVAEIIGVGDRTMRRWHQRLEQDGYDGLADRRKGKASSRRAPLKTWRRCCVRHFHEKLSAEHKIDLSYTCVQKALQGAGLVTRRRKRGPTGVVVPAGRCRGCCCT